jgi:hypothetical protein
MDELLGLLVWLGGLSGAGAPLEIAEIFDFGLPIGDWSENGGGDGRGANLEIGESGNGDPILDSGS